MTKDEALKLALDALETSMYPQQKQLQAITAIKEALAQPEPMRLRRGDILRCIETDELCTVWSTSTTGKTLIKWGANDFGGYTAEQIGELFWLEPSPDDLELAAEKSDNYAAFHAGYRFAVAHSLAQPEHEPAGHGGRPMTLRECMEAEEPEQEPVAWMRQDGQRVTTASDRHNYPNYETRYSIPLYTTPPQRKPLTDEEIYDMYNEPRSDAEMIAFARAIEAAHGIKELA